MTVSENSSAPLVVVIGITGLQGGSVARALIESDRPYRVRGITRNPNKPAAQAFAQQGVALESVSLTVGNADAIRQAFEGADIIFAVTNFHEHMDKSREIEEGKLLIDIALAVGVKLFIWSALEPISTISGGKYSRVEFFDSKGEITTYAKQSGIPLAIVQAGCYATNMLDGLYSPKKQQDGSWVFSLPVPASVEIPLIDLYEDFGLYVRYAIEHLGPGSEVLTGQMISISDIVEQFAQVTGKKLIFSQVDEESFKKLINAEPHGSMLTDMFLFFEDYGYYASKPTLSADKLARKPRSWLDFLASIPKHQLLA